MIIILSLDEFEAIRLIDHQGMDQSQAADAIPFGAEVMGGKNWVSITTEKCFQFFR